MDNTAIVQGIQNSRYEVSLGTTHPQAIGVPSRPLRVAAGAPVKLALFGVGRWGSHLLRNFLAQPQAQVVAVVDPCLERLNELPQRFNLNHSLHHQPDNPNHPNNSITLTTDWETALQLPNLEAVVIATPAVTHYPLIRSALEQGLHVLAEKPLTLDAEESIELCRLADQTQRHLVIDHTYLFHSAVQRGKDVVQQGQLGELRYGYAARTHLGPIRQDVDALWDLAIHDIAIFNHWLNQVPVSVEAHGATWLQPHLSLPTAHTFPGLSDLVWVKLNYPSGFQAVIHLCWSNPDKQRRLSIVGSQGTLVFDELAPNPLTLLQGRLDQTHLPYQPFIPIDQHTHVLDVEPAEPLQNVCTHFLTCVQQNSPSWISSGWLGAELVQILCALTRSLQQGGEPVHLKS